MSLLQDCGREVDMRRLRWLLPGILGAVIASRPIPATAQEPAPPAPSVVDSAGVALGLAQHFRAEGKRDLAEALFRLVLDRYPDTPAARAAEAELDALRQVRRTAGGTATLAAWGALYGAWLGVALPAALGAEQPSPYGAGILIGVPAGFFAARGYARTANLSSGQARAITWGSLWGAFQAMGWRSVFEIGDRRVVSCDPSGQFPCVEYTQESDRAPFTAAILGGVAGIGTAALLARSREMASGTISAVQWGSLWGTWFGVASAALLDIQGEDDALTWTLLGGDIGLLVTAALAPRWNLSAGRPWLVSAAGIAGLAAGAGFDLLFEVDDEQTAILLPMLGSAAGLVAGAALTRPEDRAADAADASRGALLEVRGRHLGSGPFTPVPTVLPAPGAGGQIRWRPGVRIPLLSVALP